MWLSRKTPVVLQSLLKLIGYDWRYYKCYINLYSSNVAQESRKYVKECNSCGKCCIKYSNGALSASKEEIQLWEVFNPDIAEYVYKGEIWVDPKTGKLLELCPFLREETVKNTSKTRYTCDIYYDRPDDCKYYPSNVQEMITDGCEMLEPSDLKNLKKAQTKLDIIMIDSHS